ncbi:hypothetical protein [uncultured Friedmanniella sp.]|uniref:hypothetical protein n=1 Tax=uncultured Friedmanniella sp. TaxID=335381 RepID=UPI0035CB9450
MPGTREAFLLPKVVFTTPYASGDCCTPDLPWGELPIQDILASSTRLSASDTLDVEFISRDDLTVNKG